MNGGNMSIQVRCPGKTASQNVQTAISNKGSLENGITPLHHSLSNQ